MLSNKLARRPIFEVESMWDVVFCLLYDVKCLVFTVRSMSNACFLISNTQKSQAKTQEFSII